MAVATNDSYSAASGATIYGGRAAPSDLPEWVPALGTVVDAGLNTLYDVRDGSYVSGIMSAWSGCAYAPWWGALGSLIFQGGGHTDGRDNAMFRYDIATRVFSKIKNHATSYLVSGYVADQTTGWMWGDADGLTLQEGEPFTSHFYGYLTALPPEALAGAPNGWLFTPGRGTMPDAAQQGTNQSHKIALGTETLWTMHGEPLTRRPGHGPAVYDAQRNRVLHFGENLNNGDPMSVFPYVDIATEAVGTITVSSSFVGYGSVAAKHEAEDCYMAVRFHPVTGLQLKVIDATTNTVYSPSVSGTAPTDMHSTKDELAEGAWGWAEPLSAWGYYPGQGGNNFYTLKCSGDPRGDNWAWAVQTVTGTARSCGENPPYSRLRYCEGADVWLWPSTHDAPVQAFRISAP